MNECDNKDCPYKDICMKEGDEMRWCLIRVVDTKSQIHWEAV